MLTRKIILIGVILAFGCTSLPQPKETDEFTSTEPTRLPLQSSDEVAMDMKSIMSQSTTQNNLTGNRLVNGSIDLQNASVVNIPLNQNPVWLTSITYENTVVFTTVMEDGATQSFKITGQSYETIETSPAQLSPETPPTLVVSDNNIHLLTPPNDASLLTNPIIVSGRLTYIANNGDLVVQDTSSQTRLPINALPDGRILVDENQRLVILTNPTDRYDHGVFGDVFEASTITLVETEPSIHLLRNIPIQAPDVIEGLSPILADMDNDGSLEIIVTVSNRISGARIVVYKEDGTLLAESKPIGLGYRWRHQIGVANFDTNLPPLLVSIRTPHIGGVVEFFQLKNGNLVSVHEITGFSSHSIGSRNLDSALMGDFNNDGISELLAPDQSHTSLGIISPGEIITMLPLGGTLTTNLSATVVDKKIFIGIGTQKNLMIWIP